MLTSLQFSRRVWRPAVSKLQRMHIHRWTIPSGGDIEIRLGDIAVSNLNITSAWTETCEVGGPGAASVHVDSTDGHVAKISPCGESTGQSIRSLHLDIVVPERVNLKLIGQEMNVTFRKKFLGDLLLTCNNGEVLIDKHRGERITINSPRGNVTVKTALEGNVNIKASDVNIQLIHANMAIIDALESVKVMAVYAKMLSISSAHGSVRVGMLQGDSKLTVDSGDISVPKLIGSVDALSQQGDVNIYIDELAPTTASQVIAGRQATVTLNPQIEATLNCFISDAGEIGKEIVSNSLDMSELINFEPQAKSGTRYVSGLLSGKAVSLYSTDQYTSGKINVKNDPKSKQYVEARAFFNAMKLSEESNDGKLTGAHASSPVPSNDSAFSDNAQKDTRLTVSATSIKICSRSWIDNLKRKHGVN